MKTKTPCRKKKWKDIRIIRVKLNPEQAVLGCCSVANIRWSVEVDRKGFTLLELIVVVIIVGILATLGMQQYTRVIEKGRAAEARRILDYIRKEQMGYRLIWGGYAANNTSLPLDASIPYGDSDAECRNTHYFRYWLGGGMAACWAYRCVSGGKEPQVPVMEQYQIRLYYNNGTFDFYYVFPVD